MFQVLKWMPKICFEQKRKIKVEILFQKFERWNCFWLEFWKKQRLGAQTLRPLVISTSNDSSNLSFHEVVLLLTCYSINLLFYQLNISQTISLYFINCCFKRRSFNQLVNPSSGNSPLIGKITCWQYTNLKKAVDETMSCQNNQLMKHQVDESSCWQNIALSKHQVDETSNWWNNVLMNQWVVETMSHWNNELMKQPMKQPTKLVEETRSL
jgi:hypothetical protein